MTHSPIALRRATVKTKPTNTPRRRVPRRIEYTPEQRRSFPPELRQAQQIFDDIVVAMLDHHLGEPLLARPRTSAACSAPHVDTLTRAAVVSAFERHPCELGLVFAELVDFADRFGFSTDVLDEDSDAWVTHTAKPRTG